MVWDIFSGVYDPVEKIVNRKVYGEIGDIAARFVDKDDLVLECACGTGAMTVKIAEKCRRLAAADLSAGMMSQARKKCAGFDNVRFFKADITDLKVADETFDKVIAGNVIHLLNEPQKAVSELVRVCKKGGMVIIPTYITNIDDPIQKAEKKAMEIAGIHFDHDFTAETYKQFFRDMGCENAEFITAEGRFPCMFAVLNKI